MKTNSFLAPSIGPSIKNWVSVSDVYRDLVLETGHAKGRNRIAKFSREPRKDVFEVTDALAAATWEALSKVTRAAVLGKNGHSPHEQAQCNDGPPEILRPVDKFDQSNSVLSLSIGTIGSGRQAVANGDWAELAGQVVLVPRNEINDALEELGLKPTSRQRQRMNSGAEASALRQATTLVEMEGSEKWTKTTLKDSVAPEMTGAGWDRVWRNLVGAFPDLGQPGRPRNPQAE